MTINFSKLVQLYRKADFIQESGEARYTLNSEDDILLVKKIKDDDEKTNVSILAGDLVVGRTIDLAILQPNNQLGRFYATFDQFVKNDFYRPLSSSKIIKSPYYIKDIDYYSNDTTKPENLKIYDTIQNLLIQLDNMSAYRDKTNKKLIFIGKNTFELNYEVSKDISQFKKFLSVSTNNQNEIAIINSFCNWMSDEQSSAHMDEKKSILAYVMSNIFSTQQKCTIVDFIKNIKLIDESVRGQYALYLENFKYEKFVKKLEESSEKFISRINDSITKVLTQILALPIAATVPTILKDSGKHSEFIIYMALLAYAIICYFALDTQKALLNNIESEVKLFERKVPSTLQEQWILEKNKLEILVKKQTKLYYVMLIIIISVAIYAIGQICMLPSVKEFLSQVCQIAYKHYT